MGPEIKLEVRLLCSKVERNSGKDQRTRGRELMDFMPGGLYFLGEVAQETVQEAWSEEQRLGRALRDTGTGADEDEWKVADF